MKEIQPGLAFTVGFIFGLFVALVVVMMGILASCAGGM